MGSTDGEVSNVRERRHHLWRVVVGGFVGRRGDRIKAPFWERGGAVAAWENRLDSSR